MQQKVDSSSTRLPSPPPVELKSSALTPVETNGGFLGSEIAAEAAEYIRLGRKSIQDSSWFDASEYFDSATVHLADLEANDSISPEIRVAARAYQDSVGEWLIQSVSQANRLGEAGDLSELLDREIDRVSDSDVKDLDAELKGLPDRDFDLPLPSPLPQPVLQALRVFTGPGRGYFTRWLQRRGKYHSLIHAKLSERGMPVDLLYLSMVESGFSSKAWSHKSASGLWQFISATGRRYGLKDDWWEDPRRDPVRATEAALDYLEDLYAEFNNWHLAMAAYNCGEGRVRRQLAQNPGTDYWNMRLPKETRLYVPKILAAMIIGHNEEFFGFKPGEAAHPPLAFDTVTVRQCLPLRSIAQVMGITEDSLKDLNPALRRWCTPPGRDGFVLCLPEGSREWFDANCHRIDTLAVVSSRRHLVGRRETLASIATQYGISAASIKAANRLKGGRVRKGQSLVIPAPTALGGPLQAPIVTSSRHKVRKGESIYSIARRFKVSVSALRESNGLGHSSELRVGQVLKIPRRAEAGELEEAPASQPIAAAPRRKVHVVRKGETLSSIARRRGVKSEDLQAWNGLRTTGLVVGQKLVYQVSGTTVKQTHSSKTSNSVDDPETPVSVSASVDSTTQYYQVKKGDSLWDISVRFGCSLAALKKMNGNVSKNLKPGQKIRVR